MFLSALLEKNDADIGLEVSLKTELDPKVSEKTEWAVDGHLDTVGGRCHFRMMCFGIHWKYHKYTELETVSEGWI